MRSSGLDLRSAGRPARSRECKSLTNEGLAIHIGPESCAVAREGFGEALTGGRIGQPSHNGRINAVIAKHVPAVSEATERTFSLGEATRLRQLLERAGFRNIEISREGHWFRLPSFDAYFSPFERGGASTGQALLTLPPAIRDSVRKEVQRSLGDTGGR